MNKLILGMLTVSVLAACSSPAPKETTSTAPAAPQTSAAADTSSSTAAATSSQAAPTASADTAAAQAAADAAAAKAKADADAKAAELALLDKRTVYFDFDIDVFHTADKEIIMAHGKNLGKVSMLKARVTGYADERGSSEYNLALGQRRAKNTKKALVAAGAKDGQLSTVSYGEEKPVATGHDEAAWAQNRRAEISYDIAK
ncbi:MAG: peptidoglycan-associated lipoprotein [Gallionellaceae bacterium]|nr:MAG: peptidoglycan-associated lipoprotein [Gallionellaceae bacterium]